MKKFLILVPFFLFISCHGMRYARPLAMALRPQPPRIRVYPKRHYGREVVVYRANNGIWQETLRLKKTTPKNPNIPQLPNPKMAKHPSEQEKHSRVKKSTLKQKREVGIAENPAMYNDDNCLDVFELFDKNYYNFLIE